MEELVQSVLQGMAAVQNLQNVLRQYDENLLEMLRVADSAVWDIVDYIEEEYL